MSLDVYGHVLIDEAEIDSNPRCFENFDLFVNAVEAEGVYVGDQAKRVVDVVREAGCKTVAYAVSAAVAGFLSCVAIGWLWQGQGDRPTTATGRAAFGGQASPDPIGLQRRLTPCQDGETPPSLADGWWEV